MKLYVGNLPWSVDDKALQELFTSYGEVTEAVLIKDKFSGRSKGFGFVTFTNDEDAKKAISEMHEKDVDGRPLTVSEAKPMVPRDNAPRQYDSNNESSEAPIANPSEINQVEEEDSEDEIETVEEAKDDANSDELAAEEAEEAEESTEAEEAEKKDIE